MKRDPLNRSNGKALIRLLDTCFRQGVFDSREVDDDYAVREFVSSHEGRWTYATLSEPDGMDWRTYRFVLYRWSRTNGLTNLSENYIMMIRKENYLWCIIPLCMWFYIMGCKEWLAYPNRSAIELFRSKRRTHWDPNERVRNFTRMDYVSYLHEAIAEYKKQDDDEKPVSDKIMDAYCQAFYDITRE